MSNKDNSFFKIFKKVNGFNVIKQYVKSRVFFYALLQVLVQGKSKKSLEIVRNSVDNRILKKLRKKYIPYILENKERILHDSTERHSSDKVWVMWLQGMDNAPKIVKKCYESLMCNLPNKQIILLTEQNYRDYVAFPDYIQNKIDKGIITRTHMSDLLRLELLNQYGGTWIDATVFLSSRSIPNYMFQSDLFLFQNLKPGLNGQPRSVSTWFITAQRKHPILVLTQELLYDYWSKNNHMMDYFLLHDFIELSIETYQDEWKKIVPCSNSIPHILLLRLFDEYQEIIWNAVTEQTNIHKLSYKFKDTDWQREGTYYRKIIEE
ncbi:capsular polysaccharide synthesis protein [Aerococcaceae bacterium zg-ZUI334]|uniref:capsular polysaccharide synthesis protein n=1 Tax=Aerococcaceae bacterium zg-252 TaxID=2796928 RepID=UPI001BA1E5D2|nr:capsular polysaccharide synthesis protein [Aerococcaceae bacterium zg-ZUI334]